MRALAVAVVVLGAGCGASGEQGASAPDDAAEVLKAPSACDPAAGAATGRARALRELRAWLDGAELSTLATEPRPPVDADLLARGARLYAAHCEECHGDRADGKGPRAQVLRDPPRDHTAGVYEIRSTESGSLPTDEDLFHTISHGVHGTAMPPWVLLSERDRWALVAHLKSLSPAFADDEAPPPLVIPTPPAETPERIAQGNQIFHTAGCSSCHGDSAKGNGPAATGLRKANGDPAHPRDLTGIHFHRGSDLTDIYRSLVTGLDGSPMASFAKVLSSDDLWSVAMYVHSLVPPYVRLPDGLRCPQHADRDPDEIFGVRIELRTTALMP